MKKEDDLPWDEQTSMMRPRNEEASELSCWTSQPKPIKDHLMKNEDMTSRNVSVKIASVDAAPMYNEDTKMLKLTNCIIVERGTLQGRTTIDLQMTDAEGNKYLVMTTGRILSRIAQINGIASGED